MEDLPSTVPLLQRSGQLRGRDVQVHGHQRDADQTHMNPPLSHLELSREGVAFLPVRDGRMSDNTLDKKPARFASMHKLLQMQGGRKGHVFLLPALQQ